MSWLALIIGSILVAECFLRLPVMSGFSNMLRTFQSVHRVISSRTISDHWKERILLVYAWRMFKNSLNVFFWLVVAVSPIVIGGLVLDNTRLSFLDLLASVTGIVASTLTVLFYLPLRKRLFHE